MTDSTEVLDMLRRRVINVVGHELRTPMTTLRGLVDLLPEASDEELHDELIPALVRTATRAEHLLDDLLIAAGVSTVTPIEGPEELDVDRLVRELTEASEVTIDGRIDARARAHASAVSRALAHLLENALVHGDGPTTITLRADDEHVFVEIEAPIDGRVEDLELAFELFWRGEEAVTRAAGLGVGLPVARALARLDGGDVTLTRSGDGVTATLQLPRVR